MPATPGRLRIVIAEDAAIMRDGLTQTLTRRGHEVVAAVPDAEALRLAVGEHRPDVALIAVRMPASPINRPAATTAIGPDRSSAWAAA